MTGLIYKITARFTDSILLMTLGIAFIALLFLLIAIVTYAYFKRFRKLTFLNFNNTLNEISNHFPKKEKTAKKELFKDIKGFDFVYKTYSAGENTIPWNIFIILLLISCTGIFAYLTKILSPLLGLVITSVYTIVIIFIIHSKAEKAKQKLTAQTPAFLIALANTLEAGYSFDNALKFIEKEIENPLKKHIKIMDEKLKLNMDKEYVLKEFAENIGHPDIDFFVESALIQMKIGGNLIEVLKKIADMIDERIKMQRDLKSYTSQGKMSGIIVCSLWFISLLIFKLIMPEHIDILFKTSAGQMMLAISMALELIGFYFVWKIINIKF